MYGAEQTDEGWQVPALLRGLPPPPANDWHCHRRLLAHSCPENLQISTPVGWASQIHCAGAQVLYALAKVPLNLLNVLLFDGRSFVHYWCIIVLQMHCVAMQPLQVLGLFYWSGDYICMNWNKCWFARFYQLSVNVLEEYISSRNVGCIENVCYSTAIHNHVKSFSFQYMAIGSLHRTLDINRLQIKYEFGLLLAQASITILHTLHAQHRSTVNNINICRWSLARRHKCEHPDVQTHACKPTETWCKWFSVSQPAPGHSQTMRSQPERDRCHLCQLCLPDHSVWLLGTVENLPDIGLLSITHTRTTLSHTHTHARIIFQSEDWIRSTSKPEG